MFLARPFFLSMRFFRACNTTVSALSRWLPQTCSSACRLPSVLCASASCRKRQINSRDVKVEMLVTTFSNGKYNEGKFFAEPIPAETVKLLGEMIALLALRTQKKFDMKVADRLCIGLIKDLHHMARSIISSDGYDVAQTAICFLYPFIGHAVPYLFLLIGKPLIVRIPFLHRCK